MAKHPKDDNQRYPRGDHMQGPLPTDPEAPAREEARAAAIAEDAALAGKGHFTRPSAIAPLSGDVRTKILGDESRTPAYDAKAKARQGGYAQRETSGATSPQIAGEKPRGGHAK